MYRTVRTVVWEGGENPLYPIDGAVSFLVREKRENPADALFILRDAHDPVRQAHLGDEPKYFLKDLLKA